METAGRSARSCRGSAGGGVMSLLYAVLRQMLRDAGDVVIVTSAVVVVVVVALSPTIAGWLFMGLYGGPLAALLILNMVALAGLLAILDWIMGAISRVKDRRGDR